MYPYKIDHLYDRYSKHPMAVYKRCHFLGCIPYWAEVFRGSRADCETAVECMLDLPQYYTSKATVIEI